MIAALLLAGLAGAPPREEPLDVVLVEYISSGPDLGGPIEF